MLLGRKLRFRIAPELELGRAGSAWSRDGAAELTLLCERIFQVRLAIFQSRPQALFFEGVASLRSFFAQLRDPEVGSVHLARKNVG